jgi:hypothetical protein
MYLTERRNTPLPLVSPGNGHVVSTDYESITVELERSLVAEEGKLTFADPGGLKTGDIVSIHFDFIDISLSEHQREFIGACLGATAEIPIPSPVPSDIPAYLAHAFRHHHVFLANAVTSLTGSVLTYRVIRPGIKLAISATPAAAVVQATTIIASNGSIANWGDGSAVFYRPELNISNMPTISPFMATTGYADVASNGIFYGVLRRDQQWQYRSDCCGPTTAKCPEVVRRGTIQVPLEAPVTVPIVDSPLLQARYAASGAFTLTGGFQVVNAGTAPPAGMRNVTNAMLISVVSDKSAIIRLM